MNIYVASSWRNQYQPEVVRLLRDEGFEVFDFRHNDAIFHWREIDPFWKFWTHEQCEIMLTQDEPEKAFAADFGALQKADAAVMVMPCGRSAHLELGWLVGHGIPTAVYYEHDVPCDPELMIKMTDFRSTNIMDIIAFLKHQEQLEAHIDARAEALYGEDKL